MVQPKTPPISIRLPPQLLALIDEAAEKTGNTRHGMIVRMLGQGVVAYASQPANGVYREKVVRLLSEAVSSEPMRLPKVAPGTRLKKR